MLKTAVLRIFVNFYLELIHKLFSNHTNVIQVLRNLPMICSLPTQILVLLFALCVSSTNTLAEMKFSEELVPEFTTLVEEDDVVLEALTLDSISDVVEQLVVNGTPVNPRHFPGVLRMVTGGTCTAALVGPATVLFAAHCLGNNTRIRFRSGSASVRGRCTIAPGYNSSTHHEDWALCLLERRVTGIVFESVDISNKPSPGARLMLTGYGCTFEGGNLDGRLRLGFSNVVSRPADLRREPSAIFTRSSIAAGGAVLCPGDSGGPLFRSGDDTTASRQIVGVNSRTTFGYGVSIFSATASSSGASFIRNWASAFNQEICGVNRAIGCK